MSVEIVKNLIDPLLCSRWNWIMIMLIALVDFVETSMVFLSTMSSFIVVRMVIHHIFMHSNNHPLSL